MIKKIVITNFEGSFGLTEDYWDEKMVITKDKIKYEINQFCKDKLLYCSSSSYETKDGKKVWPSEFRKVKSGWEYKLNLNDDYPFDKDYYHKIFEEIENYIACNKIEYFHVCDAGMVSIDVYDEYGLHYNYETPSSISINDPLYSLLDSLIPRGLTRPYFLKEIEDIDEIDE